MSCYVDVRCFECNHEQEVMLGLAVSHNIKTECENCGEEL